MPTSQIIDDNPTSYDFSDLGVLNNLPAYNCFEGVDRQLDLLREVYTDGNYYPLIVPFPMSMDITIPALQQLSGNVSVPPGSILVAMTGYAEIPGVQGPSPFKVRIHDSSTNLDLFSNMGGLGSLVAPSMDVGVDTPLVLGPLLFNDALVVITQNALQVTVLNMAIVPATIQVALHFACPIAGVNDSMGAVVEGVS